MYILNMRTYYRDVNRIVFKSQHLQTQYINTTNAMLIQQEILHIYLSLNPEHETSFFIWLKQPQLGLGLLIFEVSRSHRVTPHAHTQTHTHTPGKAPLNEWSALLRLFYLYKQTTTRGTALPSAGFEPTTPAVKWLQTFVKKMYVEHHAKFPEVISSV